MTKPKARLARARSIALVGLEAVEVTVEASVGSGLPGVHVIGSSGGAARESADRVKTALAAVGVTMPQCKALVSLAPAEVPKVGARFDLAMALAMAGAIDALPASALDGVVAVGELALDGTLRPVRGVLPSLTALARSSAATRCVLVSDDNAAEAALVGGLRVVPCGHLAEVLDVLRGEAPMRLPGEPARAEAASYPDLADVRGQLEARRALELAAAGGHHLLLVGPPGCGKSMLAQRLPSLLPELSCDQALELASVRSVVGALGGDAAVMDRRPPFRAPHHSTSAAALLGGGSGIARPGELSLATHGVLFLDELFEWPRSLLESLREPLQEGVVRVARAKATVRYPATVQLVCAANPCPCGGGEGCACADERIWTYRARLSGPLADRLDLAPAVEPLTAEDLLATGAGESSAEVAARVRAAREIAAARWPDALTNAAAPIRLLRRSARTVALRALARAVEHAELTGRGFDRALRVARTCADLDGSELIEEHHALEARAHRLNLRPPALAAAP